jgi:hypothetical protein
LFDDWRVTIDDRSLPTTLSRGDSIFPKTPDRKILIPFEAFVAEILLFLTDPQLVQASCTRRIRGSFDTVFASEIPDSVLVNWFIYHPQKKPSQNSHCSERTPL